MGKEIPARNEDYSLWYNELVKKADLAEHSEVRGCMVIKPYGYSIWEKMQQALDKMFKDTGHSNAYFPLFVPKSLFEAEEKNAEGFAKECAIVTHYRLKTDPEHKGKLMVDPEAKLEEELVVRPTSEAIIWNTYKKWIQSYRDLPILVNQWANVVRWEMRTRLFLRTAEFLWQEGHTAHATADEAVRETVQMLDVYAEFAESFMAMPVIKGRKTDSERFPGAVDTYCIEAMMQDGKALQAGTSHFLGQNFAKAFNVKFTSKEGKLEDVWGTSWGVSTRLMGALIMAHSDDDGLVLPPKLAPIHVVIVPIFKSDEELKKITEKVDQISAALRKQGYAVKFDNRDTHKPGFKFAEWELKGVPVRLAIGPRDLENGTVEVARRDTKEKQVMKLDEVSAAVPRLLDDIQQSIYQRALGYRNEHITKVETYDELKKVLDEKGGFVSAHWDGTPETEAAIKEETKATIRCIPLDVKEEAGKCVYSGKPSNKRVLFARAY
ncbi:proline--tRNA ligase [Fulvivirgaceae bacterium PWU4]|uniref:Proline--tRNA ligase n=1 Tax=Chryseosolibacter histidini TaxID=2782349 RepID=A0AAP2DQ93_9BACT|nr:proline--tRNA ligase [Chryseosolibacter histidini]MBT1700560.1 proline--tRNA ligase [Chryseosolibacter histidini]